MKIILLTLIIGVVIALIVIRYYDEQLHDYKQRYIQMLHRCITLESEISALNKQLEFYRKELRIINQ